MTDLIAIQRRLAPLLRTNRPHVLFWSRVEVLWRDARFIWVTYR